MAALVVRPLQVEEARSAVVAEMPRPAILPLPDTIAAPSGAARAEPRLARLPSVDKVVVAEMPSAVLVVPVDGEGEVGMLSAVPVVLAAGAAEVVML